MLAISTLFFHSEFREMLWVWAPGWTSMWPVPLVVFFFNSAPSLIKGYWLFLEWQVYCSPAWREELPSASALYPHMIEKHRYAYLSDRKTERGNRGLFIFHTSPWKFISCLYPGLLGWRPSPCTAHLAPCHLCGPSFIRELHPSPPQEQVKPHGKPQGNAGADPVPGLPDASHQPEASMQCCTATMHRLTLPACKLF